MVCEKLAVVFYPPGSMRSLLTPVRLCATLAIGVLGACGSRAYSIGSLDQDHCDSHPSALVCSGFEQSDLSAWDETIEVGDATIDVARDRAHSGRGALHAESLAAESVAVVAREFTPVTSGTLYFRAWLYIPADVATNTINILFLGDFATPDPFRGLDFNLEQGALQLYSPGNAPDRVTSTSGVIPRDEWFCLQIELDVAKQGAVRARVNGALQLEHQPIDTLKERGVHLLRAGVDWSSAQAERFELSMDELVLATSPLACED